MCCAHNNDIKNNNDNVTELSKYIWKLKYKKMNYDLKWNIIHCVGEAKIIKEYVAHVTLKKYK